LGGREQTYNERVIGGAKRRHTRFRGGGRNARNNQDWFRGARGNLHNTTVGVFLTGKNPRPSLGGKRIIQGKKKKSRPIAKEKGRSFGNAAPK